VGVQAVRADSCSRCPPQSSSHPSWHQSRGPNGQVVDELREQLNRLHRDTGRRVSLVGWSLGGLYAQELARASPGSIRRLITLGTSVLRRSVWPQQMSRIADRVTYLPRACALLRLPWAEPGSLRVPAVSVYSRADGIVPWVDLQVRSRSASRERRGPPPGPRAQPRGAVAARRSAGTVRGAVEAVPPTAVTHAVLPPPRLTARSTFAAVRTGYLPY